MTGHIKIEKSCCLKESDLFFQTESEAKKKILKSPPNRCPPPTPKKNYLSPSQNEIFLLSPFMAKRPK